MAFSIGLGRTGSPTQWYLPGTDITRLPSPPADGSPPVPGAVAERFASPDGHALLDGLVGHSGALYAGAPLVLDVLGAWNGVKNASVLSDEAGRVVLSGFVHADVAFGEGGDSFATLRGAKRGNVLTGDGNDTVTIEAATNALGWVDEFRVATGGGDDTVLVRALDVAAAAASDPTFAATTGNAGGFSGSDEGTGVFADLGAGNDAFIALGLSEDSVSGGAGDDVIGAGRGNDTLAGGAGDDLFFFAAGDGEDTILDFAPGADRLRLDLGPAAVRAALDAAVEAGGATTLFHGSDSVRLEGVAKSQLTTADLL